MKKALNKLHIESEYILNKKVILTSIVISFAIILLYNPLSHLEVEKFNRILGNGVLNNVDIEKRIKNFYTYYLIIMPFSFICVTYIVANIYKKFVVGRSFCNVENLNFIKISSYITIFNLIFVFLSENSTASKGMFFIPILLLGAGMFLIFERKLSINFNTFKWCMAFSCPFLLPIFLMFNRLGINKTGYTVIFLLVFVCIFLIVNFSFYKKFINEKIIGTIQIAAIPLISSIIFISIALEAVNILNQHNVFISSKIKLIFGILFVLTIASVILYFVAGKKGWSIRKWEKIYYPILIFSFSLIIAQPGLQMVVNTDLFESANHGMTIYDFFKYGKIPIMETFDAHMMSNSWGGILYGLLNNDINGAIFAPYIQYIIPVNLFLFYKVLQKFYDDDFIILFLLIIPLNSGMFFADFSLISILFMLYAVKRNCYAGYFAFWISLVISFVYKLDSGFAFSISATIALFFINNVYNKKLSNKKIFISLLVTISSCLIVFALMCVVKNINFMERLNEILHLVKSNVNWGYSAILSNQNPKIMDHAYTFFYVAIPFLVLITLAYLIYKVCRKVEIIPMEQFAVFIVLAIAYLANIQRGIVRHSLVEYAFDMVLFTSVLFLALTIPVLLKKHREIIFLSIICIAIISKGVLFSKLQNIPFVTSNVINSSLYKCSDYKQFNDNQKEKVNRVIIADSMVETYSDTVKILKYFMGENETYIDFTNQTLLYALSDKEKPVYINQSPGLLSGEYTQDLFISEIEKNKEKVDYALLPNKSFHLAHALDGIPNPYRYYEVSEYISKNFKPLCTFGDYALWCRIDKFDEKSAKAFPKIYMEKAITLNENNVSNLECFDSKTSFNNGSLKINAGSKDPMITNFDTLFKDKFGPDDNVTFSFDYNSNTNGVLQLFYTHNQNESFSEKNSKQYVVSSSGTIEFNIPISQLMKLRIDPPNGSEFIISNIKLLEMPEMNYKKCDYMYGDVGVLHTYDLGHIPYIWGTYDKSAKNNHAVNNAFYQKNNFYELNIDKINKNVGNYLSLNCDTNEDGIMTINFGSSKTGEFSQLNSFSFNIFKGKNNYKVRISSDFMWYSGEIDSFALKSSIPVSDMNIVFIEE